MKAPLSPPIRVMKFGGTSLGDPERIRGVGAIVAQAAASNPLVVVVSALAGTTDDLLRAATAASLGRTQEWKGLGAAIRERHRQASTELLAPGEAAAVWSRLDAELQTFSDLCAGISLVGELPPRAQDSLVSMGEVLAATLVEATLRAAGLPGQAFDAAQLIVSDDLFGDAQVLFAASRERIRRQLLPVLGEGGVPVVTGFRAATEEGTTTSLGRGGSDYTATVLAAALEAEAVWIWTDVDGMMTADPRLAHSARVIPELSYREAMELAFFGAKVLHPKALELPRRLGIPVRIKNSFRPQAPGTLIGPCRERPPGVAAIASTQSAVLFTVGADESTAFTRLAAMVMGWLDADHIPTLMVTQSSAENVISFAVNARDRRRVARRLERERGRAASLGGVALVEELAEVGVVVAVGEQMKGTPGVAAHLFGAIARQRINVVAIAQGSSELSISLVVGSGDVPTVVRALHQEFEL
ncbi:MAG: aspartate kinase [Candidatus Dormibacteria bacterium]